MRVARFECQQQHSCVLYAKNSAFGDPGKGTKKYLQVSSELNYWGAKAKTTATPKTTPSKKMNLYFILFANRSQNLLKLNIQHQLSMPSDNTKT